MIVDYSVSVSPEDATPEVRANAVAAVENPASVGVAPDAMAITVGDVVTTGATAMHFRSYSWVRVRASCPTECGVAGSTPPDSYLCEEDGLLVDDDQ